MEIITSLKTIDNSKKHHATWSRFDNLNGILNQSRFETEDCWATNMLNCKHHYGKVTECGERNLPDGSVQQQQQSKQLELFQASIPGGSIQVMRSHISTSKSWHKPIKFDHNSINLNFEKHKRMLGRTMINKKPPSRTKSNSIFCNDGIKSSILDRNDNTTLFDSLIVDFNSSLKCDSANGVIISNNAAPNQQCENLTSIKKKSISDENLSIIPFQTDNECSVESWDRNGKIRLSFNDVSKKLKIEDNLKKIFQKDKLNSNSFVTEESLRQMKHKLKHLNSGYVDKFVDLSSEFINKDEKILGNDNSNLVLNLKNENEENSANDNLCKFATTDEERQDMTSIPVKSALILSNLPKSTTGQTISEIKKLKSCEDLSSSSIVKKQNEINQNETLQQLETTSKNVNKQFKIENVHCTESFKTRYKLEPHIAETIRSLQNISSKGQSSNADCKFVAKILTPAPDSITSSSTGITNDNKKPKKVEFSKTEIHFPTNPGIIKIVETDGKPPSSLYRRKKRCMKVSPKWYDQDEKKYRETGTDSKFSSSSTSDNGLEVTILSVSPKNQHSPAHVPSTNSKTNCSKVNFTDNLISVSFKADNTSNASKSPIDNTFEKSQIKTHENAEKIKIVSCTNEIEEKSLSVPSSDKISDKSCQTHQTFSNQSAASSNESYEGINFHIFESDPINLKNDYNANKSETENYKIRNKESKRYSEVNIRNKKKSDSSKKESGNSKLANGTVNKSSMNIIHLKRRDSEKMYNGIRSNITKGSLSKNNNDVKIDNSIKIKHQSHLKLPRSNSVINNNIKNIPEMNQISLDKCSRIKSTRKNLPVSSSDTTKLVNSFINSRRATSNKYRNPILRTEEKDKRKMILPKTSKIFPETINVGPDTKNKITKSLKPQKMATVNSKNNQKYNYH